MQPTASSSPPRALVVFDFDWSLINENSDTYVIERLDPGLMAQALALEEGGMAWTELMDWAVGALHERGHTASDLERVLAGIPVLDGALEAVRLARAHDAELRVLSDANALYIDWILRARGLADAFAAVETNGAAVDEAGRLRITPHQSGRPHRCPRCPPNLCKGAVLQRWLEALGEGARCVYVGDGGGDFCPATRMRQGDVVLARRAPHDRLLQLCRAQPTAVRARVVEWDEARGGASLREGFREAFTG